MRQFDVDSRDRRPYLSVVVPTLDEEEWLEHCLRTVRASFDYGGVDGEIVVCDGGSTDATLEVASRVGVDATVSAPPGRARQLNRGADRARGEALVFLHADTLVPAEWAASIRAALERGASGGWCELEILPEGPSGAAANGLAAVARGINWRTRLFETATADQSLFVRRSLFETLGGFPDVPILEGAEMASMLREHGRIRLLETAVRVSGRRWERAGLVRATLSMYAVRAGYLCGVDPDQLARLWRGSTGMQ